MRLVSQNSREVEREEAPRGISPACNITEVMTSGCVRVTSSPGAGGINAAPTSQALRLDGALRPPTLSLQDLSAATTASPAEIAVIILVRAGGNKDPRVPLVRTSC